MSKFWYRTEMSTYWIVPRTDIVGVILCLCQHTLPRTVECYHGTSNSRATFGAM